MTRSLPIVPADGVLSERLAHALRLTGGTMRLSVVVADEEERDLAHRLLVGKRTARLLTIVTKAESEAARVAWRKRAV